MQKRVVRILSVDRTLLFLIALTLVSFPATGLELNVPTPEYPTIQSAIDGAADGDEVVVADGTYAGDGNRDMSFLGKAITVRSENGPSACIIDCQGSLFEDHRAFAFNNAETSDSVVQGFTIRNGVEHPGGAIRCYSDSGPTITGCVFENNTISSGWVNAGGAIHARSNVTIIGCTFTGNEGSQGGGAVHCYTGTPTITDNSFIGNDGNYGWGGGILLEYTTGAVVSGNLIIGNEAASGAGIGLLECADTEVSGNVIAGNAGGVGGGVFCSGATADFFNNTIADNSAGGQAGGLYFRDASVISMTSEIIWGNTAGSQGPAMCLADVGGGSTVTISCSIVDGGYASCKIFGGSLIWGAHMNDIDPVFCDADSGNYQVAENSFCTAAHQPACGQIGALPMGCGPMTVGAAFDCTPSAGALPFVTQMRAVLTNLCFDETRRVAGRIDVLLASGGYVNGWRHGYANVPPDNGLLTSWNQNIPATGSLLGDNEFTLVAVDVTPAPYNQPPYWPSGSQGSNAATVTGVAP